jgi:hypothetical protein
MAHTFDDDTLTGVLGHMNDDHSDDNLLIARAFAPEVDVVASEMVTFDGAAGQWHVTRRRRRGRHPRPLARRADQRARDVRREIVALYDEACARLGITRARTDERRAVRPQRSRRKPSV